MKSFFICTFILFINNGHSDTFSEERNNSTKDYVAVPGRPSRIEIQNITDTSVHVLWTQPGSKENITHYKLEAKVIHTFSNFTLYSPEWTFSSNILRSEIAGLHPATKYNVSIRAVSKNGPGLENYEIFETLIAEPDHVPDELTVVKRDSTKMVVQIPPVINNNGPVSFYRLVVINIDQMQIFQSELLQPFDQAFKDDLSYYIAADIKPEDISEDFTIGDGRRSNGFFNAPLLPSARYYAFVGVVSSYNGKTLVRYPDVAARSRAFAGSDDTDGSWVVTGLAVAVAIASVLLVIGVVVLVFVRKRYHRNRRQRLSDNQELSVQGPMIQVANHGYIPDEDLERINHYAALKQTVWNIPREKLQVDASASGEAFLGFGSFGHVVHGSVQKLNEKIPVAVACYVVTDGDLTPDKKRKMLRQLDILVKTGNHDNISALIGTHETPETVYIVMEHHPSNLKDMLLNSRNGPHPNGKFSNFNELEILDLLIGIANGMNHLSQRNLVHERLCARNICMMDGTVPKITGHGLSHYNRNNTALDFTRWTAQEVFNGKPMSTKSDVWSYGVLMWEVAGMGGTPYNRLDKNQVSYQVSRGVRLPKFPYISEEFYQVMISCWQTDPGERPSFHEISQQLTYFKDTLSVYLHLDFSMTSGFVYELCEPTMEIAEDVCQRRINHS